MRSYTWDSRNRLIALSGGGVTASFAYDGEGRRIRRTVNGVTTRWLYDGPNAIQEQGVGGIKANLLAGGVDQWYVRSEGGKSEVYVPDALGSTLALSDATGAFTTRYAYAPYGATTTTGATSANAQQYTGRENDGTGLYYYRARYYHPGIGRFISEDPIGLAGGMNLYGYANQNPLSFTDPLGLSATTAPTPWPFPTIPGGLAGAGSRLLGGIGLLLSLGGDSRHEECDPAREECKKECVRQYERDAEECGVAYSFWGSKGYRACMQRAGDYLGQCMKSCDGK